MKPRITSIFNAWQKAKELRKEVHNLVSIAMDFEEIPWFNVEITPFEGKLLLRDCESAPAWVQGVEQRPDRSGVKINGVWFWWENVEEK